MALYTYESPEAGDLTFVEGDVVIMTEREGEWWRGCIGDQTGVFPSNYVRPVELEVRHWSKMIIKLFMPAINCRW